MRRKAEILIDLQGAFILEKYANAEHLSPLGPCYVLTCLKQRLANSLPTRRLCNNEICDKGIGIGEVSTRAIFVAFAEKICIAQKGLATFGNQDCSVMLGAPFFDFYNVPSADFLWGFAPPVHGRFVALQLAQKFDDLRFIAVFVFTNGDGGCYAASSCQTAVSGFA